jgi:hypothetical protein
VYFIPDTGESLMFLYRGLMTPVSGKPYRRPQNLVMIFIIFDEELEVIDLTFPIVWELG